MQRCPTDIIPLIVILDLHRFERVFLVRPSLTRYRRILLCKLSESSEVYWCYFSLPASHRQQNLTLEPLMALQKQLMQKEMFTKIFYHFSKQREHLMPSWLAPGGI